VNGKWGSAQGVPVPPSLGVSGYVAITTVSCARQGSCSAGGYFDGSGRSEALVASQAVTQMAALGDSYSSGKRVGSYYPGTNRPHPVQQEEYRQLCSRDDNFIILCETTY
jgi:hypothetical protein